MSTVEPSMLLATSAIGVLLIWHLVGDFLLQTDDMADKKSTSHKVLGVHAVIYAMCMLPACLLVFQGWEFVLEAWLLLSISHAVIDGMKGGKVADWLLRKSWGKMAVFCIDQALHLAFCVLAIALFPLQGALGTTLGTDIVSGGGMTVAGVLALLLAALASCRPAAILVKVFLFSIEAQVKDVESSEPGIKDSKGNEIKKEDSDILNKEADDQLKAGRWIGILERIIVVVMTFWSQYNAIAFVFTAKSIARFKMLEEQDFAERYLVGTLASVAVAIVATLVAKGLFGV